MFNGDEVATFFGFMGAASALVFSCKFPHLAAVQQQQLSILLASSIVAPPPPH
jgi:hypothetical protein